MPDGGVLAIGLAAIAAFVAAFYWSGLVARASAAVGVAQDAMTVIGDKTLEDEEKQPLVQAAALRLFGHFGLITLTAFLVLLAPGLVIWLADMAGVAPLSAVTDFLLSWQVILISTVVIGAGFWIVRRA